MESSHSDTASLIDTTDGEDERPMRRTSLGRHALFVVVNLALIVASVAIYFVLTSQRGDITLFGPLGILLLVAVPFVILEYRWMERARSWKAKLVVLYLTMLAFMVVCGLPFVVLAVMAEPSMAPLSIPMALVTTLVVGHTIALPGFPLVALGNLLLGRWLFTPHQR